MDHVFSPATLTLFLPAVFILLITPGPVVLYIVTRSIDQGRAAGLISVLGSEIGNLVHVLAAALGLSAILLSSTLAFDAVKYLGAGYLIYLGIRKLMARDDAPGEAAPGEAAPGEAAPREAAPGEAAPKGVAQGAAPKEAGQTVERAPLKRIFFQGIAVAVLNPKTALFFFAFLPQFVDRSRGQVALQILLLGLMMLAFAIISDSCYALAAGAAGRWLRGSVVFPRIQRYVTGTVYIGLGVAALFAGKRT